MSLLFLIVQMKICPSPQVLNQEFSDLAKLDALEQSVVKYAWSIPVYQVNNYTGEALSNLNIINNIFIL